MFSCSARKAGPSHLLPRVCPSPSLWPHEVVFLQQTRPSRSITWSLSCLCRGGMEKLSFLLPSTPTFSSLICQARQEGGFRKGMTSEPFPVESPQAPQAEAPGVGSSRLLLRRQLLKKASLHSRPCGTGLPYELLSKTEAGRLGGSRLAWAAE